jgi:hypothetical protein
MRHNNKDVHWQSHSRHALLGGEPEPFQGHSSAKATHCKEVQSKVDDSAAALAQTAPASARSEPSGPGCPTVSYNIAIPFFTPSHSLSPPLHLSLSGLSLSGPLDNRLMYLSTLGWTPSNPVQFPSVPLSFCFARVARALFFCFRLCLLHHDPNNAAPTRAAEPPCVTLSGQTLTLFILLNF